MVAFLGFLVLAGQTVAAPSTVHLNWGIEVNPGKCPAGDLVININHKVTNDMDSAVGGGFWAVDNYNRQIQVLQVYDDTFCALARYEGSFITDDGASPQGTDTISAGIQGTFQGGYRATIIGNLKSIPDHSTRGNIGTFDYNCDISRGNRKKGSNLLLTSFSFPSIYES